jgi:hypothetical protein
MGPEWIWVVVWFAGLAVLVVAVVLVLRRLGRR